MDQLWPYLAAGFQKATDRTGGDITTGDLWQGCRRGDLFLFIAREGDEIMGASIWKPETWQSGVKFRNMGLYGRKFRLWIYPMRDRVERVAKDCGATSLLSEGRVGWAKVFPKAKVLRVLYEEQI